MWGRSPSGGLLFGVSAVRVLAYQMQPLLVPCAAASQSTDAREKLFPVKAASFDQTAGLSLRSESASMRVAAESLSARTLELQEALSGPTSCELAGARRATRSWRGDSPRSALTEAEQMLGEARAAILDARAVV